MPEYLGSYISAAGRVSDSAIRLQTFSGWRRTGISCLVVSSALLGYAFLVPIDVLLSVRGTVVPAAGVQHFQAPIAGQIMFPHGEGSSVLAGEVVATIHSTLASSQLVGAAEAAKDLAGARLRLSAEAHDASVHELTKKATLAGSLLATSEATLASLRVELRIRKQQLDSADSMLDRARKLGSDQLISEFQLRSYEDKRLELESAAEAIRRQIIGAQQSMVSARSEMDAIDSAMRAIELDRELDAVEIRSNLEGALASSHVSISAPSNSTIASLLFQNGSIVAQGDSILTLVPASGGLIVEADVPNSQVAMVQVGQSVKLVFDALPTSEYGFGDGVVTSISQAATPSAGRVDTGATSGYVMRVRMEEASMTPLLDRIQPGMQVTLQVSVDRRPLAGGVTREDDI